MRERDGDGPGRAARVRPFLVHVFTACGAACALLAMLAAAKADFVTMFVWLAVALFIDGIDGTLARKFHVAEILPRWSGDALDLVVDFTTYVFVPAFALAVSGLLPQPVAIPLAIAIVVTSALYFADEQMKTADNYFRGFPAVWNAPVFYLFLLRPDPWIAAAAVVLLVVLTFVPVPFLHPFRVRRFRALSALLIVAWSALAAFALVRDMSPGPWVTAALCAIALYFLGAGLLRRAETE
jgi:phosphatidylcholine synthase